MKIHLLFPMVLLTCHIAFADSLPIITTHPQSQTVAPGGTASFTVAATGATGYQWRLNGTNIAGATAATLQIANAQSTNSGYYMVVVRNTIGYAPSQLAYL